MLLRRGFSSHLENRGQARIKGGGGGDCKHFAEIFPALETTQTARRLVFNDITITVACVGYFCGSRFYDVATLSVGGHSNLRLKFCNVQIPVILFCPVSTVYCYYPYTRLVCSS